MISEAGGKIVVIKHSKFVDLGGVINVIFSSNFQHLVSRTACLTVVHFVFQVSWKRGLFFFITKGNKLLKCWRHWYQ